MSRKSFISLIDNSIRKAKRLVLVGSGVMFAGAAWWMYAQISRPLQSKPGQVFTWSAGHITGGIVEAIPWYAWLCVAGVSLYLWSKHKLVMSLVFGIIAGLYFAF